MVFDGQKLNPVTLQQKSVKPEQHVLPRLTQIRIYEQRAAAQLRKCNRELRCELRASLAGTCAHQREDPGAPAAVRAHEQERRFA